MYYKHAKKKILEIKQLHPAPETQKAVLAVTGGTRNAAVVAIALSVSVVILAAITIPQFAIYRMLAHNAGAQATVENACQGATAIYRDYPNKNITRSDLERMGFIASPGVEFIIQDGKRKTLKMSASHKAGDKIYSADAVCLISEQGKPK